MDTKRSLLVMTALLAWGCSGGEPSSEVEERASSSPGQSWLAEVSDDPEYKKACAEVTNCGETRFPAPGPAETIWRIQIVRSASGEIHFGSLDSVPVPAGDGVPLGPPTGTHALVGLDASGEQVDGQMIRFPETLRIEFEGGLVAPELLDLADREVDTIGFVRALPEIKSFAVLDVENLVQATAEVPASMASNLSHATSATVGFASPAWAATQPWGGLPPYCSHILLLEGEADRGLARGIAFESELLRLVVPGPWQLALTRAALGRMTPLLCQSVRRIAFGYLPNVEDAAAAVQQAGTGDMMVINVPIGSEEEVLANSLFKRLYLQTSIIHEAGHSAEALLHAEGSNPRHYAGAWGFPARTLANKTIDNVRLEKGLSDEWLRVHDSFIDRGWARDYQRDRASRAAAYEWSVSQTAEAGFMTHYGATAFWDDIAEFVALTYMAETYVSEGWSGESSRGYACEQMAAYDKRDLPSRLAAVYTKLLFLRDLGLVTPEDVRYCQGDALRIPVDTEGFHVWQGTMQLRSFENHVKAGIGTEKLGNRVFEMKAEGEAEFAQKMYPTTLLLRLDLGGTFDSLEKVSWPRGAYQLGLTGDNNVELRLDGAKAGNFDAMDGFVVVAEASNDRIAGSIVLQRVFRMQAPLPVPEKYDPPLIIRFLLEN